MVESGLKYLFEVPFPSFGHKEGDQALVDTSQILKKTFRESDIIARIGGDEFVILATNSVETSAEKLINRFEQVLNDHPLQTKRPYTLFLNLGLACFDPQILVPSMSCLLRQIR